MKKVMILVAVAAMFAMVGCSKTKTCDCITTQNIPLVGPTEVESTVTIESGSCSDMNSTSTTTIEGVTVTTTIKCTER